MKKVVHVLSSCIYAGAENIVIKIIKNMDENSSMTYVSPRGPIEAILDGESVDYFPIDNINIWEIRRMVKEIDPDIIHAHDYRASVVCAFSFPGIPVLSHLHSNPPWRGKICSNSILYLLAGLKFKKILTVSDVVLREYIFRRAIEKKTFVVGNPFDTKHVREMADLGYVESVCEVLFLGRLVEEKDPLRFIDLMSGFYNKNEGSEIKACIVGTGELEELCKKRIEERGLEGRVLMTGFLENPFPILSKAKLLVVTSKHEGFGLVALEAMALGIPVVSTPVGGLLDIVDDSCGSLCASDEDFILHIEKNLYDHEYWNRKAKGAIVKAEEFENIDEWFDGLVDLIKIIK